MIKLTENKLHQILKESIRKTLHESFEYDNMDDDDIDRFGDNYTEVTVPDFCLPYLVNGTMDGYNDDEIQQMQDFENEWTGKLLNGLTIGDVCIPLEGRDPSFTQSNDVFGNIGCDCYRFLVPLAD